MFLLETRLFRIKATGLQNTLKSGAFVVFTVNKKISSNIYQISILGKYVNVKSSKILHPGSKIHAQTFWLKNRLQLKVLDDGKILNSNINNEDRYTDPGKKIISESLVRTYMPLDPAYFEKILSVLRNNKKIDHKLVKILLLMIDKGIPLSDTNIDEILSFSGNFSSNNAENQKRKNQSKQTGKFDKETIKENIKNQIKKIDSGNELLKYFNHSIGKHDNWLIIPLSFDYVRTGHGILKLRLNDNFLITNLVLTLGDGNTWDFNLTKSQNRGNMRISGPNKKLWEKSPSFLKLKEKLYNKGIIIDDINSDSNLTDGFTNISSGKLDSINFIV